MRGIQEYLFIYDMAAGGALLLLSYLSRQLGSALKIPPYYRAFYVSAAAVFAAFVLDTLQANNVMAVGTGFTLALRLSGGVLALAISLRYW